MIPQLVFLLCFGKLLPKPNLTAWPTSVVPPKSKVTLRCRTSIGKVNFALRKEGDVLKFLQPPDSAENQAEFPLNDLQHHNSGNYTCEYYRRPTPYFISPPSDVLLLLVTGNFTKPSLQAHPSPKMTLGGNVTLQCQKPSHVLESARFILLKEGNPEPIQHMSPVGNTADFSLQTVTFSDTGNYSCVYYQTDSPFMASNYSNSLEIQVTVSPGTTLRDDTSISSHTSSEDYTKGNIIRLGLAVLILIVLGTFLTEAWYNQTVSPCGSRSSSVPKEQ